MISKNKIVNSLLYAGLTKEDFREIEPRIIKDNKEKLLIISISVFIIMIALIVYTFVTENYAVFNSREVYVVGAIISAFTFIIGRFGKGSRVVVLGVYTLSYCLILCGIGLSVISSDNLSVAFMVFIVSVPIIFSGRPIRKIVFIIISLIIFLIVMAHFKTAELFAGDCLNGIVYSGLSMYLSTYTTNTRAEAFSMHNKLKQLSESDPFTKMGNRLKFDETIDEISSKKTVGKLQAFVIDIDKLKLINDTFGHETGDMIILAAAECIKKTFEEHGKCFRLGGDEFYVIVDGGEYDGKYFSDLLSKNVATWQSGNGGELGLSCGFASTVEFPEKSIHDLINIADARMYEIKRKKN